MITTSNYVNWTHPILYVPTNFVKEPEGNRLRVYDKNGQMLRQNGNRLVTNNGNEYSLSNKNRVLIPEKTTSRKVKVLYNNGVRFVARIPKPHVGEILAFYPPQKVLNRKATLNNGMHAIHINAKNIRLGNISSNRQLVFLVNPENQNKRISSTIFYPSARANAPGARLIKNGQGKLRDCRNSTFSKTQHPRDLKENLNHYKCNINSFRTQLKPGDGILFNYNVPHSIPWYATGSRKQKHYRVGGETRNQIIEHVRTKHKQNAKNFV